MGQSITERLAAIAAMEWCLISDGNPDRAAAFAARSG